MAFVQLNNEMFNCSIVNYVVLDTVKQEFNLLFFQIYLHLSTCFGNFAVTRFKTTFWSVSV